MLIVVLRADCISLVVIRSRSTFVRAGSLSLVVSRSHIIVVRAGSAARGRMVPPVLEDDLRLSESRGVGSVQEGPEVAVRMLAS